MIKMTIMLNIYFHGIESKWYDFVIFSAKGYYCLVCPIKFGMAKQYSKKYINGEKTLVY